MAISHYLNHCWIVDLSPRRYFDIYLRAVSLGPNDAIWRQKTGSILAQVMACCLTAPNHYLNQSWLISSVRSSDILLRAISQQVSQRSITCTVIGLKSTHIKFHYNLPGHNEFNLKIWLWNYKVMTTAESPVVRELIIHLSVCSRSIKKVTHDDIKFPLVFGQGKKVRKS